MSVTAKFLRMAQRATDYRFHRERLQWLSQDYPCHMDGERITDTERVEMMQASKDALRRLQDEKDLTTDL